MNRRSLLLGSAAVAIAAPSLSGSQIIAPNGAVLKTEGIRVSCLDGDPGMARYAEALADGMTCYTYLDGVEVKGIWTADEREGYVVRPRKTAKGNIMVNPATGDILEETVYGDVKVVIA